MLLVTCPQQYQSGGSVLDSLTPLFLAVSPPYPPFFAVYPPYQYTDSLQFSKSHVTFFKSPTLPTTNFYSTPSVKHWIGHLFPLSIRWFRYVTFFHLWLFKFFIEFPRPCRVNVFKLIDSTRILLGDVSSSLIFHCFHSVPNRTCIAMRSYFFYLISNKKLHGAKQNRTRTV